MTIREAIDWLKGLERIHGSRIELYFDCPKCRISYTPADIETMIIQAVHVKGVKIDESAT